MSIEELRAAASAADAAYAYAVAAADAAYAYAVASAADAAYAYAVAAAASASASAAASAAAYAVAAADPLLFLDQLLDAWEEAITKEGEDLYVPQAWEDAALAFVDEFMASEQGESE